MNQRLKSAHFQHKLRQASAFNLHSRRLFLDLPKILRIQVNADCADILFHAMQLGGSGDRHDPRLLPPDLSVVEVIAELYQLKCSAILRGFRGSSALDVKAAAEIVCRLGSLVSSNPEIRELDINPVVVYPKGQGALALDALIFCGIPQ